MPDTFTIGETNVLGNYDGGNAGLLVGQAVALGQIGTLLSLSFYCADTAPASTLNLGEDTILTSDDGGNGGLVLAQSVTLDQLGTLQTLSFYVASAPPTSSNFGQDAILTTDDGGNGGQVLAQFVQLSQAGTLQSLSFYCGTTVAGTLSLGIYDASGTGGDPGHLLAKTAIFTAVAGWNTVSVITPVALTPGSYWLAYNPSSDTLSFKAGSGGPFRAVAGTSLPSTFPTATSGGGLEWSFYATLTVPGSPDGTLSLGLYNNTPGGSAAPGQLLAKTATFTPVAGWNTAPVITPVLLNPGNYWLAYCPSSSSLHPRIGPGETYKLAPGTSLLANFPTPTATGGGHWSFYATLDRVVSPSPAGTLTLGLYDTSISGNPGKLLAQTPNFTCVLGWNTVPVITPVGLHPGNYWLAYCPSSNALNFKISGAHDGQYKIAVTGGGPVLPPIFPPPSSSGPFHWSFYATFMVGILPPPVPVAPPLVPGRPVPAYAGQNQPSQIVVPKTILYRQEREESCWVMPPYAMMFPDMIIPPPPLPIPPAVKAGLLLFGGVQGWASSYYTPPDPMWKPISSGPATGSQWPSNWWRDDFSMGDIGFDNYDPATMATHWDTARQYCDFYSMNGPCVQLYYPGRSGDWTIERYTQFLSTIAPYQGEGTFQIAINEVLGGGTEPADPLLDALGGPGATGWDGLIALIKLQRQYLPTALLGLNEFNVCDLSVTNSYRNAASCVNVYRILRDNGAPLDWLGCEGYWANFTTGPNSTPESVDNYDAQIKSVGAQILPFLTGACGSACIGFTEFTPGGYYCGAEGHPALATTQQDCWNLLLTMFAANPYVFGVNGPWESFRRSNGFSDSNWFWDDTAAGGQNPDCTTDAISPSLAWLQGWVAANVHPLPALVSAQSVSGAPATPMAGQQAFLPPPIQKTSLWDAMQTFPL